MWLGRRRFRPRALRPELDRVLIALPDSDSVQHLRILINESQSSYKVDAFSEALKAPLLEIIMFRNNYDNDSVTLWVEHSASLMCILTCCSSPQGRIFQVEYAQEAVKQGSVVVGLVSKTHAVLVALKVRVSLVDDHE
jgi:Proteasome subunit A N-terminal signature